MRGSELLPTAGLAALMALLGVGSARTAEEPPVQGEPLILGDGGDPYERFVHADHRNRFLRSRFSCLACHPIGMVTGTDDFEAVRRTDERVLNPAREICHDCHTGEIRFPQAVSRCDACHEDLAPLLPEDHGLGWERDHARASLLLGSSCDLCHTVGECTSCHARRDQGIHRAHPATFRSYHGIEARLDPSRCQRCHLRSSCEACHAGGGLP
jgi:hypothetical protein